LEIIQLLATLGLLGVTAWYAKTTKDMADIAKVAAAESARATEAALKSAEAARDAATVAQSQITPDFEGRLTAVAVGDEQWVACVKLRSTGDAVVAQSVRVRRAFRAGADGELLREAELVNQELHPFNSESALPRRLHRGEALLLTHDGLQETGFQRLLIDVAYTFSEDGGAGATRELIIDDR
jgi:hypothetical protein